MRFSSQLALCALLSTLFGVASISIGQEKKAAQPPGKKDAFPGLPAYVKDIRPILQTYCFECHGAKKKNGDLDLERIKSDLGAFDALEIWGHVAVRLKAKDMPPAKKPQPKPEEVARILAFISDVGKVKIDCNQLANDENQTFYRGYVMSRRLNRGEYNNTVRDLFGVDLKPGDMLPSDGAGGEGFDNTGGTLFTTEIHLEKFLDAADLVLDSILPPAGKEKEARLGKLADPNQIEAAKKRLLTVQPGPKLEARAAAKQLLTNFARRAFRRPVKDAEIERFLTLFDRASKRGDSYDQALKLPLKAILINPNFLFLIEPEPEKEGVYRLGHYPLAARLAYFLWATMPDDTLFKLADEGKLHDEKVLREQVQRMMRDPKARGLADNFAVQWLAIRPLGVTVRPDRKLFKDFDDALADAMRLETVLCFDAVMREDRSLLELIDANYTFVNEPLAKLYEIKGVKGPAMQKVKLEDPRRGGILGQASILTVTSYPSRTSPVLRGRWLLEELLGSKVPPPPPGVPELSASKKKGEKLTLRQQLELHRTKAECASCHNKMDPLGFGLENYDVLGRWRTKQDGQPIDASGVLPTGEKFDGVADLKKLLLGPKKQDFLRNLSRKMLGYSLGRELNRFDQCVVDDCLKALETGDFRTSSLLETIVVSYPFTHRYFKR